MRFTQSCINSRPGFLLMEALLALLLFSGFGVVIGMYWQHLARHQKSTQAQLQAVSSISGIIDSLLLAENDFAKIEGQANITELKIERSHMVQPHLIKGQLHNFDNARLVHVRAASAKNNVTLSTVIKERV